MVGMLALEAGQGRMAGYELRRTQHAAHALPGPVRPVAAITAPDA